MKGTTSSRQRLKALREARTDSVARARERIKTSNQIIKKIRVQITDKAMTIPQIAESVGAPSPDVLVYVAGLKKYGMVVEIAKDGDYFTYQMTSNP